MEIQSSSDLKKNLVVRSLSIGDSGKGKTWFAGSIAKYGNPFIIDSEKGLTTIANHEFDSTHVSTFSQFGLP